MRLNNVLKYEISHRAFPQAQIIMKYRIRCPKQAETSNGKLVINYV